MASLPLSSVAIDLSRLPAPNVIETLSFDAIRADMLADFKVRWPAFTAVLESDPVVKLIEVFAYRELTIRQNFNERAVSMLLPFARGADLDNLAAFYGVARLDMESDDALLRRVLLAPDAFSVAGPEAAYVYHALSAEPTLSDASAYSPSPGVVLVSLLSDSGSGAASAGQIAAVQAVVNADGVRPLTDFVTVASAEIVAYAIEATLQIAYGPDTAVVLATANASLAAYLARRRRIGRLVSASGIAGALQVDGVETVRLLSPPADISIAPTQAAHPLSIVIEVTG